MDCTHGTSYLYTTQKHVNVCTVYLTCVSNSIQIAQRLGYLQKIIRRGRGRGDKRGTPNRGNFWYPTVRHWEHVVGTANRSGVCADLVISMFKPCKESSSPTSGKW